VIRVHVGKAGAGDGLADRPERFFCKIGTRRLRNKDAVGSERGADQTVERPAVEARERHVVRVRQVGEDHVVARLRVFQKNEGVAGDRLDARAVQAARVEPRERRVRAPQLEDGRVQVRHRDVLDGFVFEHLARGQPVTPAQDEHAARALDLAERHVDERFVVAVLVAGGELEVAVQKEAQVRAIARHHDALVARLLAVDDAVFVDRVAPTARQRSGGAEQQAQPHGGGPHEGVAAAAHRRAQGVAEPPQAERAHAQVDQPEHQGRAKGAQQRQQHERERQRRHQRPEVVEGQDVREVHVEPVANFAPFEDAREERDFQPRQRADGEDQERHRRPEEVRRGVDQVQQRHAQAADDSQQPFHRDEGAQQVGAYEAREVRPQPHRRQVQPDGDGELAHAVAQEVRRRGAHQQLVDERAQPRREDGQHQHLLVAQVAAHGFRRRSPSLMAGVVVLFR